MYKPRIISQPD